MYKSIYEIKKMDCPSEKSMIEIKLSELGNKIIKLDFDFINRTLVIYHDEKNEKITKLLNKLDLGSTLQETQKIKIEDLDKKEFIKASKKQKKILITVLLINFSFFVLELGFWIFSNSMWLIADSLDMLSDSFVYFISLFAIWWSILLKKKISKIAGILQVVLAFVWLIEVIRRFISPEQQVDFKIMIWIAVFAFIWNYYALYLFNKQNSCDPHMKASQICTSNDLIVNVLVALSILISLIY